MAEGSLGDHLREAREKRGLSIQALARQTRVPEHLLQAIEANALEALPPEIYVRGFIRAVSKEVGISEVEPLALHRKALDERRKAQQPDELVASAGAASARRRRRLAMAGGGAALLVLILVIWLLRGSG